MDDSERILDAFAQAGYPLEVVQRPDGMWEVNVGVEGTSTTLFARANTRDAAVEHAAITLFPWVFLAAIGQYLKSGPLTRRLTLGDDVDGSAARPADAESFGGFGVLVRFRREPDDSYSWGVFDEITREGLSSGVANALDDAKLEALMRLAPPHQDA